MPCITPRQLPTSKVAVSAERVRRPLYAFSSRFRLSPVEVHRTAQSVLALIAAAGSSERMNFGTSCSQSNCTAVV